MQILFGDFADAGDLADIERREEASFFAGQHPENAVGLGLIGGDFGDHARGGDADGAVERGVAFDGVVQAMRGGERRPVQALGAGEIHVGFVDRGHVNLRRECFEDFVDLARVFAIARGVAVDEDGLRAEAGGGAQRHGGVDSELARGIGRGRDDAALVGLSADDDGLADERGVEELFDGDEEGVHVDVEVGLHWGLGHQMTRR